MCVEQESGTKKEGALFQIRGKGGGLSGKLACVVFAGFVVGGWLHMSDRPSASMWFARMSIPALWTVSPPHSCVGGIAMGCVCVCGGGRMLRFVLQGWFIVVCTPATHHPVHLCGVEKFLVSAVDYLSTTQS